MKKLLSIICIFIVTVLCCASCSDEENTGIQEQAHATFLQDSITVPYLAGEAIAVVEWMGDGWTLDNTSQEELIASISQTSGNSAAEVERCQIRISYTENTTSQTRSQEIVLIDKATSARSVLKIIQQSKYSTVNVTVDPTTRYQLVHGFGGMYNPVIWIAKQDLITSDELNTMFSKDGLGYNILRLMIYPDESRWKEDVEGALQAQQLGATIFACPWDCTDALADEVEVNGKKMKHLPAANYSAYADHLIRYIDFMQDNGVNLYAVSVQNEPDMEFTFWTPAEIAAFVRDYGERIRATGVKLMSPEACGFSPDYTDAILNDEKAFAQTDLLVGHLYQGFIGTTPYEKGRHDYICNLYQTKLLSFGKGGWWMTEHLFNEGQDAKDEAQQLYRTWNYCLNQLGMEVQMCMEGYCSAYVYWYLKRFYGMIGDSDPALNTVPMGEPTKNGYILSQFAKYATGKTRIKADAGTSGLMVTAYANEDDSEITLVLLNPTNKFINVEFTVPQTVQSASGQATSEEMNMDQVSVEIKDGKASIPLSIQSITSVRLKLK